MPDTYSFSTENAALAAKIMALMWGHVGGAGHAPAAAPAAPPVPAAPVAPPVPAAPVAPPAPAAPAPAPAAVQHGEAPAGWTIQHVQSVLQALGANPAKGGPAAVKAILERFGVKKVTDINPAQWHEVYAAATAA